MPSHNGERYWNHLQVVLFGLWLCSRQFSWMKIWKISTVQTKRISFSFFAENPKHQSFTQSQKTPRQNLASDISNRRSRRKFDSRMGDRGWRRQSQVDRDFFLWESLTRVFFLDIKNSYALDQINRYSTTEYLKPQTPIGHVYPNLSHCKMPGSHTLDKIQYLIISSTAIELQNSKTNWSCLSSRQMPIV